MATEIERKFLVTGDGWRAQATSCRHFRQAYLVGGKVQLRVRISDDNAAFLTVKSAKSGAVRAEFEYPIPLADARDLFALATAGVIEKHRHLVPASDGLTWEVDVFDGENEGLVMAEIELESPDQPFAHPDWLGREVTSDPRYFNSALALAGTAADGS